MSETSFLYKVGLFFMEEGKIQWLKGNSDPFISFAVLWQCRYNVNISVVLSTKGNANFECYECIFPDLIGPLFPFFFSLQILLFSWQAFILFQHQFSYCLPWHPWGVLFRVNKHFLRTCYVSDTGLTWNNFSWKTCGPDFKKFTNKEEILKQSNFSAMW